MKPRPLLATGIAALLVALPLTSQQAVDAAKQSETDARLAKLETWMRSSDQRARWRAIHACARMGNSAVPMLTGLLEESPKQGHSWPAPAAAKALVRLGPKAVECLPATMKVLKDGNMAQKKLALDVLAAVGPYDPDEAEGYKNTIYSELRTRRGGKRTARMQTYMIVECMVRLTEDPKADIDDLIVHLHGESAAHREMALDWLAVRGRDAREAIPAIRSVLMADKQPRQTRFRFRGNGWGWSGGTTSRNQDRIRIKAALLLMKLGAGKDIPVAAHVQLLKHEDPAVRQRAVLELGSHGDNVGAKGIQALQLATTDRDKLVAWDAITALGMIGPAAKAAVPRLEALARGQDKAKAARADAALRRIKK